MIFPIHKSGKNRTQDKQKKIKIFLMLFIFVFAFCWELFLTYGINFVWEDYIYFQIKHPEYRPAITTVIKNSFKEFFNSSRLFQIGFSDSLQHRPYQHLFNQLIANLFSDNVVLYRIFKSIVFAVTVTAIFLVINVASTSLALIGIVLYSVSGSIWLEYLCLSGTDMYSQLAELILIGIFLYLLKLENISWKKLCFFYGLIIVLTHFAILIKGNVRYLAMLFFLTLLIFRRNKLFFHLPFLVILLTIELPILGFIKKLLWKSSFSPIDLSFHVRRVFIQQLLFAFQNRKFPIQVIGELLLILFSIVVIVHLISLLLFRKRLSLQKTGVSISELRERSFLFFFWFLCNLIVISLSRGFEYDGYYTFQKYECSYLVAPFIIFLCYYIKLVSSSLYEKKRFLFITFCIVLISTQSLIKVFRLNRWRGGWGNFFCALNNTKRYVESVSDNALVILTNYGIQFNPFVFVDSKNQILLSRLPASEGPFNDMSTIEEKFKEGGWNDIFVVQLFESIDFKGESDFILLKEQRMLDGNCGDLYDRFKNMLYQNIIGPRSRAIIYLYHFTFDKEK